MTSSEFQANGVWMSSLNGEFLYYLVQFYMHDGRPYVQKGERHKDLRKRISEQDFELLRGEMAVPGDGLRNNGFFTLKIGEISSLSIAGADLVEESKKELDVSYSSTTSEESKAEAVEYVTISKDPSTRWYDTETSQQTWDWMLEEVLAGDTYYAESIISKCPIEDYRNKAGKVSLENAPRHDTLRSLLRNCTDIDVLNRGWEILTEGTSRANWVVGCQILSYNQNESFRNQIYEKIGSEEGGYRFMMNNCSDWDTIKKASEALGLDADDMPL